MAANPNTPLGFRAITNIAGTAPTIRHYNATLTGTVFQGAPVMFNASYLITNWTLTAPGGMGAIVGVAAHARKAADTNRDVAIIDARDQEFEVQLDNGTPPTTLATLLDTPNYAISGPAGGSATTLQSTAVLDASTGATTNTTDRVFRVSRFSPIVGQDNTGDYARVIGKFVDEALYFEKNA